MVRQHGITWASAGGRSGWRFERAAQCVMQQHAAAGVTPEEAVQSGLEPVDPGSRRDPRVR